MKTALLPGSLVCGWLVIATGSPWYLLPQFAALGCWCVVFGIEVYEMVAKSEK